MFSHQTTKGSREMLGQIKPVGFEGIVHIKYEPSFRNPDRIPLHPKVFTSPFPAEVVTVTRQPWQENDYTRLFPFQSLTPTQSVFSTLILSPRPPSTFYEWMVWKRVFEKIWHLTLINQGPWFLGLILKPLLEYSFWVLPYFSVLYVFMFFCSVFTSSPFSSGRWLLRWRSLISFRFTPF